MTWRVNRVEEMSHCFKLWVYVKARKRRDRACGITVQARGVYIQNTSVSSNMNIVLLTHATLFAIKGSNNKKTKKKKRNKPSQDKSNTTGQHNSILGLIFSTQSTNDIIGYGELAQKIRFSITYAQRKSKKGGAYIFMATLHFVVSYCAEGATTVYVYVVMLCFRV